MQTFLCRAYTGDILDNESNLLLPAPLSKHPSWNRALHAGIEQAFLNRAKLQRSEAPENPLTVQLPKAASLWISSKLSSFSGQESQADRKLRDAYWMSLDIHEQNACRLVVALEKSLQENAVTESPTQNFALAAAMMPAVQSSAVPASAATQAGAVSPSSVGPTPAWETDDSDSDLMFAEGRETGGFVPPRK